MPGLRYGLEQHHKDRFITIQAVAEILSCTERHIYDLIMAGSLVAIKVGSRAVRVSERSLHEFIENSRVKTDDFGEPEPDRAETDFGQPPARSKWMSKQRWRENLYKKFEFI